AKYGRGIPGISGLLRLARFPELRQGGRASRTELDGLVEAARQVARGEQTLLMYPEGHRSRDGRILPFKSSGLRLAFQNAPQVPVYLVIVDGLWQLRTFAETARSLAGTTARVRIVGPYTIPPDSGEWDGFVEELERNMILALEQLRSPGPAPGEAARSRAAG
ncbi:MAG: 1-acyl-sn-glycerol-3-phosphate acyltransferase, partial [Candidatus Eisenbacteria bacterium]|nr:1-acyl-sn-glycerol-3-phosphate acyltransferase [Candidatus Eisenbacteria bacterium]